MPCRCVRFVSCFAAVLAPSLAMACWHEAELRYGVSSSLLYAIARTESDLNPAAVNLDHRTRTGTYDIGLMQINSGHLPKLAASGISESDLYDPCTNIKVGAWLLSQAFSRHGVSWNAVGSYNAACTQLKGEACTSARSRYAWRVYRRLPADAARISSTVTPAPFILAARVSP
jgi:soluble lytic murein transglycosylase-like protein